MRKTSPLPQFHAINLSAEEAKALYVAIQVAGVSRIFAKGADAHTLSLFDQLSSRLRHMIPAIEESENRLVRRASEQISPNRRTRFCASEHCSKVVQTPGDYCNECQDDPGAA